MIVYNLSLSLFCLVFAFEILSYVNMLSRFGTDDSLGEHI